MEDSKRVSAGAWRRYGQAYRRAIFSTLFGLVCVGASFPAWGQGKPANAPQVLEVRATVVTLDGEELVIDLGAGQGATVGALVEIWRPLRLRHPVSGKILEDRFRIGSLELTQVRTALSLAKPSGEMARAPQKGDVVILQRPASATLPSTTSTTNLPPATSPPTGEPAPEVNESKLDADARAVVDMFNALEGADVVMRIRVYEEYVRANPKGKYARVLYEEAAALRKVVDGDKAPKRRTPEETESTEVELEQFEAPKEVLEASKLEFVVQLSDMATGALLHYRRKGEPVYETINMTSIGPGFWAAFVPSAKLAPPVLEYFIEATTRKGFALPLVGGPGAPKEVDVLPMPKIGPPRSVGASAMLLTDYADYNRLRGNDWSWQTEGIFGLRYDDVGIRALRTGFGVYRGRGGSLKDLDVLNLDGRPIGLTYGYLELEVGAHRLFSILGRAAIGLQDGGVTGGGQVIFRIGNDRDTNLLLGGELLGRVGLRGFTQLELNTIKKVPILIRTEVTNQPAGSAVSSFNTDDTVSRGANEIGVRTILQAGYRFTPEFVASLRVSFQGRTIDHAGPGFGGAVGYSW